MSFQHWALKQGI